MPSLQWNGNNYANFTHGGVEYSCNVMKNGPFYSAMTVNMNDSDNDFTFSQHFSLEQAKAACQREYERITGHAANTGDK